METSDVIVLGSDWVEKIAKVLKGSESFSYQTRSESGKRHEISISVIWDQEAHDLALDFSILARIWPRLDVQAVLQTRKKSILNQLDRIRSKRLHGLSSIDGYTVSSSTFDQSERKTMTVVFTKDGGIDLNKSSIKTDQNERHQEIALIHFPGLAQFVISHIYNQLTEMAEKNSNSAAIANIETVLQTLLAIVQTRLEFLQASTTPIPMWD